MSTITKYAEYLGDVDYLAALPEKMREIESYVKDQVSRL